MSHVTPLPTRGGEVTVDESTVRISGLEITDPAVVTTFHEAAEAGDDLNEIARQLLIIGAKATALSGAFRETERLDAAIEQARKGIADSSDIAVRDIRAALDSVAGPEGRVAKTVETLLDGLVGRVEQVVAGEDAPVRLAIDKALKEGREEIRKDLAHDLGQQHGEMAKLVDPTNPTSPLKPVREDLQRLEAALTQIRDSLIQKKAADEVAAHSTAKGLPFEEAAVARLQALALGATDLCEGTGAVKGISDKTGDAVVSITTATGGQARIVMEAKAGKMSAKDWRQEAAKAMPNRAAQSFLGLAGSDESMPMPDMRIWVDRPDLIVVRLDDEEGTDDLLHAVYQLLRLEAMSVLLSADDVDVSGLSAVLTEATKSLQSFDQLHKNLSTIANATDSARKQVDKIRRDLIAQLDRARDMIGADEDGAPEPAPEAE